MREQTDGSQGRTTYFATFYLWMNGATLLLLVFGANRLIDRVGLIAALLTLPVSLALGTAYLLAHTVLIAMVVVRILENALEEGLYSQAADRLLLEIDEERAPGVRPLLQGLAVRVGSGLGALLVLGLVALAGISLRQLLVAYGLVVGAWILAVLRLRPAVGLAAPPSTGDERRGEV